MKCRRCGYFYREHPYDTWEDWRGVKQYQYFVDKNCPNLRRQQRLDEFGSKQEKTPDFSY
jgi:rubredoxin